MLAREYLGGASFRELARKYGGTDISVRNAIRRTGTTFQDKRKAQQSALAAGNPEAEVEALLLYRQGMSVKALAKKYRCRDTVVSKLLSERGAVLHPGGRHHPFFRSDESCLQVAMEYEAGASLASLARRHGCAITAVKRAIERAGATTRPGGRSVFWTPERIGYVIAQYKNGRSQQEIASELGVSQAAVSGRLKLAGVVTRGVGSRRRERHAGWRGGRVITGSGYVDVMPDEADLAYCTPHSNGYVSEHRLVMGRALGRPLTRHETVHHINGDRTDNRLENLQLRQGRHGKGVVMICQSCGSHDVQAVEITATT